MPQLVFLFLALFLLSSGAVVKVVSCLVYAPPPVATSTWIKMISSFLSEMFNAFFYILPWWIRLFIGALLFCFVAVLLFKWVL